MQDQPTPTTTHRLQFTGSGSEYFRIWIVNILLTVCTLYIYSAWAKVRSRRYFYGNTVLDGSSFEYHAKGKQLLLGSLIGLGLVGLIAFGEIISPALVVAGYVVLSLLAPWAICRSKAFNARMSSYRNVRFGFSGQAWPFYKYLLLFPLIPLFIAAAIGGAMYFFSQGLESPMSLDNGGLAFALIPVTLFSVYAMLPWLFGKINAYTINKSEFGTAPFSTSITAGKYARIYYKAAFLSVGLFVLIAGVIFGVTYTTKKMGLLDSIDVSEPDSAVVFIMMGMMYTLMIPVFTLVKAYIQTRTRNYQFNNTILDGKFTLSSDVTIRKLWWLELTNLLMVLFSLGLAYPWAAVRKARFMVNHTQVTSSHNADQFVSHIGNQVSAIGDGIGDAFDMDIAAGF